MLQLNFNPKKTTRLFGLENDFNFFKDVQSPSIDDSRMNMNKMKYELRAKHGR